MSMIIVCTYKARDVRRLVGDNETSDGNMEPP